MKVIDNDGKEIQLGTIIRGRIDPCIYAFTTEKLPHYLKVGDTYRGADVRIAEWESKLGPVTKIYEGSAKVNENVYFRDYAIHKYLVSHGHPNLEKNEDNKDFYSKEFFEEATESDVKEGTEDVISSYDEGISSYDYYDVNSKVSHDTHYERNQDWPLRRNQSDVVDNFMQYYNNAKDKNKPIELLMYAVMRFGKSYTALHCAKAMNAHFVIVVSAKGDVQTEWKKNIQSPIQLDGFVFADDDTLKQHQREDYIEKQLRDKNKCLVLVLTLQTLSDKGIKKRHQQIYKHPCDLLIVDETHYGAWADKYGAPIKNDKDQKAEKKKSADDDFIDVNDEKIKKIKRKVALHLSGTPYRLLKEKEFRKEQLISFCSMADIAKAQKEWYEVFEQSDGDLEEWQNPYFGFPEMIRFGFELNKASKERLDALKERGISSDLSTLFRPYCLKKDNEGRYKTFYFEQEVLDFLKIIDGSKSEEGILGFLNLEEIKKGRMCEHIVMVLPYCASCDAMEKLLKEHKDDFINLVCDDNYKIINISGLDGKQIYKEPDDVKKAIKEAEDNNQKTITLTVNRLLTGSTVEQWDTMIYLKSGSSAQEYDQSTFRIQSQNVELIKQKDKIIKICKKPQTLLVDFDLNRMFLMQEQKSSFYDVRDNNSKGNSELQKRIDDELRFSPILVVNGDKIKKVQGVDVLKAVSNYHANIGIKEEASLLPVDFDLAKSNKAFKEAMENENEIGSNKGFRIERPDGKTDIGNGETGGDTGDDDENPDDETAEKSERKKESAELSLKKKIQNYYARILAFAFVYDKSVASLKEVIDCFKNKDLSETLNNLGLQKNILKIMQNEMSDHILSKLDYSIQDMSNLSHNKEKTPEEIASIAVKKFNAFGSNEIPTNNKLCLEMLKTITDIGFASLIDSGSKILDMNSKVGEFAVAINEKAKALSLKFKRELNLSQQVYSIPSSQFTKELVKKVYKLIGFNLKNISGFTSEELIEKFQTIRSKKKRNIYLNSLLEKDLDFCDIFIV